MNNPKISIVCSAFDVLYLLLVKMHHRDGSAGLSTREHSKEYPFYD